MPHEPSVFINLPVSSVDSAARFYTALGMTKNTVFSSNDTTCMVLSPHISVMLMEHSRFKTCTCPTSVSLRWLGVTIRRGTC